MTRDYTSMKELRESYMLDALNKLEEKMKKMKHYLKLEFGLDITDFAEIEVLSSFCSELYMHKLPISDEVVRILLRKLRKCQDILRKLREVSAQKKEDLAFISVQLNTISEALTNIKKNATHLKYLTKDVCAIVSVSQSANLPDLMVFDSATLNQLLLEEETTDQEDEEIVNPDIYLEAEPIEDWGKMENFHFLDFTPLPPRPEST
ncbi:hypothetical protein SAMN05421813_101284 [Daejeonella rubra]|uniref:Uncharacterized protein n=1 Tax=Daejeonella rubra TaxID=990371 RepID=A0A1G9M841_9SPHI|nr:hypothetical protein [Daejeonella rubra]SDL70440.1 hypothetical protein SAMN05421813_101284 [Daejeonella rubra]